MIPDALPAVTDPSFLNAGRNAASFSGVVPARGYSPKPSELRFDMYQGEYTHVDERCTFEVLLQSFALHDSSLTAIGEIVHDIDVKDDKYGRKETAGVLAVVQGIASATKDDAERIARGAAVFDGLYEQLK